MDKKLIPIADPNATDENEFLYCNKELIKRTRKALSVELTKKLVDVQTDFPENLENVTIAIESFLELTKPTKKNIQ